MPAQHHWQHGAPTSSVQSFPGPLSVSPCTLQAHWVGSARVHMGIYCPAEGTLFFLLGLDALQEQFGDLNSVAAKALGLQVKTS